MSRTPRTRLPLLGLAAVAGLAGLAAAPAARAASVPTADNEGQQAAMEEIGGFQLYPLAGTPLDVLSNNLRVPVGGMDVSTFPMTAPLRDGLPIREVPVVGRLLP